jgi:hypothetical protein
VGRPTMSGQLFFISISESIACSPVDIGGVLFRFVVRLSRGGGFVHPLPDLRVNSLYLYAIPARPTITAASRHSIGVERAHLLRPHQSGV